MIAPRVPGSVFAAFAGDEVFEMFAAELDEAVFVAAAGSLEEQPAMTQSDSKTAVSDHNLAKRVLTTILIIMLQWKRTSGSLAKIITVRAK